MKNVGLRLPDVEASMFHELQKSKKHFTALQDCISAKLREVYQQMLEDKK